MWVVEGRRVKVGLSLLSQIKYDLILENGL